MTPAIEPFELEQQVIDCVDEPIDRCEVLRYLGYPVGVEPNRLIEEVIEQNIEEAAQLASPRAIYLVRPVVEISKQRLCLQTDCGLTEFCGAIGEFLGYSQSVAVFIATAGPAIEQRASELLRERDDLGAMVLNAVGAERAEAAEAAMIEQLREQALAFDLAPSLPYSPGYCGMKLTEQRKLFSMFTAEQIGVELTSDCLMKPIKSVSGLIGLGKAEEMLTMDSPCDRCELQKCDMRR